MSKLVERPEHPGIRVPGDISQSMFPGREPGYRRNRRRDVFDALAARWAAARLVDELA
jgi:hypothetical protein